MKLDFIEALKAPFKQGWFLKSIGAGIILLIPIVNLFVFGFTIKYVKNISNRINEIPKITDKTFITGFKFCIGSILLTLPMILLTELTTKTAGQSLTAAKLFFDTITIIVSIATTAIMPAMILNFSNNEKITSMIDISIGIAIIKRNIGSYFMMLLYAFLLLVIYSIAETICTITIIGILLLMPLVYLQTVSLMNLFGQYCLIIKSQK